MGIIKSEAQRAFFDSHRSNADLVKLFLKGFDITFACEKHISNTFIYRKTNFYYLEERI